MNTFNIENTFKLQKERGWWMLYVLVDLHGTLIRPNHDKMIFYPDALEVIRWFNNQKDFKVILWTSSHKEEISLFLSEAKKQNIRIDFVNENPLEADSELACFAKKFYFNIILDDKAGFRGDTDWTKIKNLLIGLGKWNDITVSSSPMFE